jgi:hypothetical protein
MECDAVNVRKVPMISRSVQMTDDESCMLRDLSRSRSRSGPSLVEWSRSHTAVDNIMPTLVTYLVWVHIPKLAVFAHYESLLSRVYTTRNKYHRKC